MRNLRDLEEKELKEWVLAHHFPVYRAEQIYRWVMEKDVQDFSEMLNLPKNVREALQEEFTLSLPCLYRHYLSKLDETEKFLFTLSDGHRIESVLMRYHHGNTACISTQVGCRMGCAFCASTLSGLARNCTAGEMLGQIVEIERISGKKVSNIVLMGSGEPLDNYDEVLHFLHIIGGKIGRNLSMRNITLSTCGIVPGILKLAEENLGITLALSLHAPTDEKRKKIMPIANRYSLSEVMDAVRFYFQKTGRRVSFEYALVLGVNDGKEDLAALVSLLKKRGEHFPTHVNLIPVNPIKERDFAAPDRKRIMRFQEGLEKQGISCTIRREMGADISGACGQLRRDAELEERREKN